MNRDVLLEIRDLTVRLPPDGDRALAVDGMNLQLRKDEILCLVGESGSGKSLTGRAIMGLLPRPRVYTSGGSIRFGDEDLLKVSPARLREIRGNDISMIFQEPMTALNPVMTIGNQINEVVAVHRGQNKAKRKRAMLDMLVSVQLPEPEKLLDAYPHQLSGGQRQRAMIAMALVLEPKVLIADEPTTALDVTIQAQILKLIKELQKAHHTGVLFITHDFGVVAEISDRVAVMQEGKVVEFGESSQVLNHPRHPYTRSLIDAVPSLVPPTRPVVVSTTSKMLVTRKLNKTYGSGGGLLGGRTRRVHAAKNIDLELRRGETIGIVGESGSGKSTLARCIVRLIESDGGDILIDGENFRSLRSKRLRSFRKRIQMVFQDPYGSLNPRYTVGRLIAEGQVVHGADWKTASRRTLELLELVGLDARSGERYPHEFSGGQRQRIAIARALALEPDILVADEPVSALDVSVQAQVLQLLADIRDRLNISMVFITHDLRVAAQVCDGILVMRSGEIVERGQTWAVFSNPQHPYTRELLASVPGRDWSARSEVTCGLEGLDAGG